MAGTNAISGISLVGSLRGGRAASTARRRTVLGFIAVICATINVVGGFLITDRMLRMFKKKGAAGAVMSDAKPCVQLSLLPRRVDPLHPRPSSGLGVPRAGAPRHPARPSSACCVAVVGTLLHQRDHHATTWIILGLIIGSAIGTAMSLLDPDDQDAGADRALARVRRPRGGAGRRRRVLHPRRPRHCDASRWARSASRCSSASSRSPAA